MNLKVFKSFRREKIKIKLFWLYALSETTMSIYQARLIDKTKLSSPLDEIALNYDATSHMVIGRWQKPFLLENGMKMVSLMGQKMINKPAMNNAYRQFIILIYFRDG